MLIDKYIENALYIYQCVIIPSFGGFVAREQGAEVDGEKFSPGFKRFVFNRHLRVNDGVLASYIANMREISYAEAVNEISKAVDYWLSRLEKHDAVEIDGVGTIKVDEQENWVFIPLEVRNYQRSSYGLESSASDQGEEKAFVMQGVEIPSTPNLEDILEEVGVVELENSGIKEELLASQPPKSEQNTYSDQQAQAVNSVGWGSQRRLNSQDQVQTPRQNDIRETSRGSRRRDTNKKIWIGISVCFVFMVAFVWLGWGRISAYFADEPKKIQQQIIAPVATVIQDTAKVDSTHIKKDTVAVSVVKDGIDTLNFKPQKRYYVIAGAIRDEKKAQGLLTELKSKAYDAQYAGRQKGLYMISYGSFSSKKEANDFLEEIVNQVNSDAWIKVYNEFKAEP